MSWQFPGYNPNLFPNPVPGYCYSRFHAGEIGSDIVNLANAKTYQGVSPMAQGSFSIAPGFGSPTPTSFNPDQANAIGPGVTSGATPNS